MKRILSPVLAAALVSPMALLPAAAQTTDSETSSPAVDGSMDADTVGVDTETSDTDADGSSSTSAETSSDSATSAGSGGSDMTADADPLIVTVGDAEITASDVQTAIEAFPPQLAQQVPPEQLISVAVDQLVLRELILQRAEQENLSEDPEVQQMIEDNGERSREDAIVQVYVQRAMDEAISDEAVQGAYDEATSQTEQELPPIDQVRPQIEQQLRQERLGALRQELIGQGTEITFYDEQGQPVEDAGATSGAMSGNSGSEMSNGSEMSGGDASDSGASDTSGSSDSGSMSDSDSSDDANSGTSSN
ncbi:hypothetical protein SAMN04488020_10474 [Palleronia marisminoris]|uniref:Peptidylprolyl isomerase n=1 Tax=Palleronia marisminoris TaxID=315423 RepID=A0A1Y5SG51_9RHOB|nr:SurA N-terminal domain-containing protein [Palleronia marisminoris]SFG81090.1 hypothetical protein SAMN04488020_10474 [Palleronia marisminoris]SLN39917.1 hypothetical protein PAM7066_01697 [Palleronia marisminoris]